ncbi:MAG: hypothetical protein WCO93_07550 [bacterium]
MSKTRTNLLTFGYSGLLGDQFVLKQYKHMSVLSKKPTFKKNGWTDKQKHARVRFGIASLRASRLSKIPAVRQIYEKKIKPGQNILNLILQDVLSDNIKSVLSGINID